MAEIGETVKVHVRATLDDGSVIQDSRKQGGPLRVRIGDRAVLPRVEALLLEMLPGDRKTMRLEPQQAFGAYDPELVITMPIQAIGRAEELPVGAYVQLASREGPFQAKVLSKTAQEVVFDLNHELAGFAITYDIELLSVVHEAAIYRELHPSGCACGCDRLKMQLSGGRFVPANR